MIAIKGLEFRRYVTAYPLFWIGFQDKKAVHIDVFYIDVALGEMFLSTIKLYP